MRGFCRAELQMQRPAEIIPTGAGLKVFSDTSVLLMSLTAPLYLDLLFNAKKREAAAMTLVRSFLPLLAGRGPIAH